MRTPLAILNILHQPRRFAVAVAGVAFATTLILMQLGFFGAVLVSAVLLYDRLPFDFAVRSPSYVVFAAPSVVDEQRMSLARSYDGVTQAAPLWVGRTAWQNQETRLRRPILVIGVDPLNCPLQVEGLDQFLPDLQRPGTVVFDLESHKEFGDRAIGTRTEAGRESVEIVGQVRLGTGFSADGALIVGRETFRRLCGGRHGTIALGLLSTVTPADVMPVVRALREAGPADTAVLTRDEVRKAEQWHWLFHESLGVVFLLGLVVSIVVGIAVVYQLLSAEITDRFKEYATLKAMGYRPRYLAGVILQQAALLAASAFPPALGAAAGIDAVSRHFGNVPVHLWPWRIGLAFVLTVLMCCVSGLLSIRKVQTADPADLF